MLTMLRQWYRAILTSDLYLLGIAIIFSTTLLLTLHSIASRLKENISISQAQSIAGDFRISHSNIDYDVKQLQAIMQPVVNDITQMSQVMEFNTMIYRSDGSEPDDAGVLSAIKAIDNAYPLKGKLEIEFFNNTQSQPLASGTAWVDEELLLNLQKKLGEKIWLNEHQVTITGKIISEPDRLTTTSMAFFPRVMIALDDVKAIDVLVEGSRFYHLLQFIVNGTITEQQQEELEALFTQRQLGEKLMLPTSDDNVDGISQLLILMNLLTMLLCGYTVIACAIRFSAKQYRLISLLSTFNMSRKSIRLYYLLNISAFAFSMLILGFILSLQLDFYIAKELESFTQTPTQPTSWLSKIGLSLAIIAVLIVSLAHPIIRITKLDIATQLRLSKSENMSGAATSWLVSGCLMLVILMFFVSTLKLLAWLAGVIIIVGIAIVAVLPLISLFTRLFMRYGTVFIKLSGASMLANKKLIIVHFATVVIVLFPLLFLATAREQFFDRWQDILDVSRPNYFLINIFPEDVEPLTEYLESQSIRFADIVPEIRMRLKDLPDSPDSQWLERRKNTTLRLSVASELPASNEVTAGEFWQENMSFQVSLAEDFAEDAKVKLNDRIQMVYGGKDYTFTVTSLRKVEWTTMNLNFWLLAQPTALDEVPRTYLSSLKMRDQTSAEITRIRSEMRRKFPNVLLFSIDALLIQAKDQLSQLGSLINVIVWSIAITAVMALTQLVISSALQLELFSALCRILGASTLAAQTSSLFVMNFNGFLAGAISGFIAQIANYIWFWQSGFETDILWWYIPVGAIIGLVLVLFSNLPVLLWKSAANPYHTFKASD